MKLYEGVVYNSPMDIRKTVTKYGNAVAWKTYKIHGDNARCLLVIYDNWVSLNQQEKTR